MHYNGRRLSDWRQPGRV